MSLDLATFLVRLAGLYLLVGAGFAVPFAIRWAGRLDPVAASATIGFRVLLLPGATLLWPLLTWKLLRRAAGGAL
jgi:hypothetical protein